MSEQDATTGPEPQARSFGRDLRRSGGQTFNRTHQPFPNQQFQPLPQPTGTAPYHLSLDTVLPTDTIQSIAQAGRMVFHMTGDTGGVKSPQPQQIVAMHLDSDLGFQPDERPAFFYHPGDVVYYNGEASKYYDQFYEPYQLYRKPIFAIPGNHDGDPIDPSVPSLAAFVENFCAETPQPTPESEDSGRDAMTQPNVYWTLEAPFMTIIGLYTNVPEGGEMHQDQADWFSNELATAPKDKALFVTLHHPVYSLDTHHSGSLRMKDLLDTAFDQTGVTPHAVFSGHVHDYQRFTRQRNGTDIPYIVAGAGGYWNLHYVMKSFGEPLALPYADDNNPDTTLQSYCDTRHGYLRLEISQNFLRGTYVAVPRPQESWNAPGTVIDTFTLDLQHRQLIN